jgi:adenine-specific DNA-methyltransferase
VTLDFTIHSKDFILVHADCLTPHPRLFSFQPCESESYDLIISNPPYFKIPRSDPRAQAAQAVVHGQPNIYALFMAISAVMLKIEGQLVFITPRSFAAGSYFRRFREHFFSLMRPELIHLFSSRRDAFKRDDVLQENVILLARRLDGWFKRPLSGFITVSHSQGAHDLPTRQERQVLVSSILDPSDQEKILRIPVDAMDDHIDRTVNSWQGSLHTYGWEISTGPVVPFRALSVLSVSGDVPATHAPLLWMQNVRPMRVEWPIGFCGKRQYIAICPESMPLLVANKNYVLLRRFSAKEQKRRLTAAPLLARTMPAPIVGLENHLNYIYSRHGSLTEEEAYGLAMLLNCSLLDSYFRIYNGNTQVSATEVREMPLPSLETIQEIGRRAQNTWLMSEDLDQFVEHILSSRGELPVWVTTDDDQNRRSAGYS